MRKVCAYDVKAYDCRTGVIDRPRLQWCYGSRGARSTHARLTGVPWVSGGWCSNDRGHASRHPEQLLPHPTQLALTTPVRISTASTRPRWIALPPRHFLSSTPPNIPPPSERVARTLLMQRARVASITPVASSAHLWPRRKPTP
nr:hypothetical protein HmN_000657800 [Hymenolepis microstoma]